MNYPLPSPFFCYRDSSLYAEQVDLTQLAQKLGTPTFVYSANAIRDAFRKVDEALHFAPHLTAYAVKANGNLSILRLLAELGAGADIVSGGELARCRKAGFDNRRIVFSGVGKTAEELQQALESKVHAIHVESEAEFEMIEQIATALNTKASIALRINPDVDPQTHPYISTGLHSTKFGLEADVAKALVPRIVRSTHVQLQGIACHIGSQLADPAPIREAVQIVGAFARECADQGAPIEYIDAGGGWPIAYACTDPTPDYSLFGAAIEAGLRDAEVLNRGWSINIEPGRCIVGNAGILLTKVILVKKQAGKRFVVVDAAMTDLLRPALYKAHHEVVCVSPTTSPGSPADIVGPVCESADFIALDRSIPEVGSGDLLAIGGAGAYCAVMGSTYNARLLPAEVLVDGDQAAIARQRQTYEDLWRLEP